MKIGATLWKKKKQEIEIEKLSDKLFPKPGGAHQTNDQNHQTVAPHVQI